MSNYYDIACLDCLLLMGVESANRQDAALQHVVDNRKIFSGCFDLRIDGILINTGWLHEHINHKLAVKSEYESVEELVERVKTDSKEPRPRASLAQAAYEAWDREAREHVGSMPPFESLPRGIQNAWTMAVNRVAELLDDERKTDTLWDGGDVE